MKKKLFLALGVLFFVWGVYYFQTSYEIVYAPTSWAGSIPLESRSIQDPSGDDFSYDDYESDRVQIDQNRIEGLRIGDFVIRGKK